MPRRPVVAGRPDIERPGDIRQRASAIPAVCFDEVHMDQAWSTIQVAALSGSLRPGSYTTQALAIALEGARELGAQTQLVDLNDYQLIFARGKLGAEAPADVLRLRDTLRAAHGILLGTPEYHGSFSGVLKNALDLMGFEEFEGKVVGLVSVSGGAMGGASALTGLAGISRALHAWTVPEQASLPFASRLFDPAGQLKDLALAERLRTVGRQVARFAYLHSSTQARDFLRQWEQAMSNPGG